MPLQAARKDSEGQPYIERTTAKTEAQRLIAKLPKAGRDVYELHYGGRARGLLEDALDQATRGDKTEAEALREVVKRFRHTKAGEKAAKRFTKITAR